MAERLSDVETRLASIQELHAVMGGMRALAASRLQQAAAALGGTRAYAEVIGAALARALNALRPDDGRGRAADLPRRGAIILICSEHGFVGSLNDLLVEAVAADVAGGDALLIAGNRGAGLAEERDLRVSWRTAMASQIGGVPATARHIADEIFRRTSAADPLVAVDMVFMRRRGEHNAVERQSLLPIDFELFEVTPSGLPPLMNLEAADLVGRLAEEYVTAELTHAVMEGFASENGARLTTMLSANQNIKNKLAELRALEHRLRQEEITNELLDLTVGAAL